ncbi:TRAP transporter small permease [Salinisphaera aquimarina]|uniref:TRAP transporter small permease protein n=1 Tax=Salinisphaera aquimarina TaxID=2094031 RepID=A0ABV7EID7_9GAMM
MATPEQEVLETLDPAPQVPPLGGLPGRLIAVLDTIFSTLAVLSLLGIAVVVLLQIICRLLLPFSPPWTEELSRYLFIYMVSLSSGVILRRRRHISLELFQHRLALRGQALHQMLVCIALGGFSLIVIEPAWRFASIGTFQTSPALGMPMIYVFSSMAVLLGLVAFYSLLGFIEAALALWRPPTPGAW